MQALDELHLLDLAGERDADGLADKQLIGGYARVGLEHLGLRYAAPQALLLEGAVVRRENGTEKFSGLHLVLAVLETPHRRRIIAAAVARALRSS